MNHIIAMRVIRVFSAVAVVVAYSISLFWLGSSVERKSLNNSLAGQNNEILRRDMEFNTEFKARQIENRTMIAEILKLSRECRGR